MKIFIYINKIKNLIIDILFPVRCLGCSKKDEILCDNCISKITITKRLTEENINAMFDYRDTLIKKAIWQLKYNHKRYFAEKLGELLYEFMSEEISDLRIQVARRSMLVVPVPISMKKNKLRGYNQSLYIAKGFCRKAESHVFEIKDKIIFKKIDTTPQAKITNRKDRLMSVRGVFEIKKNTDVRGRTIIVIDDVTTTGGTISEIIKTLKKAGAKKVIGFAVAH